MLEVIDNPILINILRPFVVVKILVSNNAAALLLIINSLADNAVICSEVKLLRSEDRFGFLK